MSRRTKGIIVTGILLVIAIATLSYALWSKTFTQEGENELASGCFDIQFSETDAVSL